MNQDPAITIEYLADFTNRCRWMKRSKDWKLRLLFRLAVKCLDLMTQQALTGKPTEKTWQQRLAK